MTPTLDELMLITLYKRDSKKATIEEIKEMMTYLEEDESELKALSEKAIKMLSNISDDEFNETDFYSGIDILE